MRHDGDESDETWSINNPIQMTKLHFVTYRARRDGMVSDMISMYSHP
jgi:hypothetical protein